MLQDSAMAGLSCAMPQRVSAISGARSRLAEIDIVSFQQRWLDRSCEVGASVEEIRERDSHPQLVPPLVLMYMQQQTSHKTPPSNRGRHMLHRSSFAVALSLIAVSPLVHAQSPATQQPEYSFQVGTGRRLAPLPERLSKGVPGFFLQESHLFPRLARCI